MTSIGAALPGTATGASSRARSWKLPIVYGVLTLVALLLFVVLGRAGQLDARPATAGTPSRCRRSCCPPAAPASSRS